MREMMSVEDLLETCLQRLHSGTELDVILADYPEEARILRPLLETAREAFLLADTIRVPVSVQNLNRAKFLTAAAASAPSPLRKPRFSLFHWRLAASALMVAIILAVMLTITGFVSAGSLPGDVFYPVKLMVEHLQIDIVQDPPARLELEEKFDDRRVDEVTRLNQIQRREYVSFSGVLLKNLQGRWVVDNLELDFPADFSSPANMAGFFVLVSGYSDTRVVMVEEIQLRSFQWDGTIQKMEGYQWLVSGVELILDQQSQITGAEPRVGAHVRVNASRTADSRYLAVSVSVDPLPTSTPMPRVEKEQESSRTLFSANPAKTPESTEKHEEDKSTPLADLAKPTATRVPTRYEEGDKRTQTPPVSSTGIPSPTPKVSEDKNEKRTPTRDD